MTGESNPDGIEATEPTDVCEKCGSKMISEAGKLICPHCDAEINFFGENEDE